MLNSQEAIKELIFQGVRAKAIRVVANITLRQYNEIVAGKSNFSITQISRLNKAYGIEIEFGGKK